MVLPELPDAPARSRTASASPPAADQGDEMPELHLFARAARASRGPILVLGTAVTVALSGGYAAGHAFGWKMPPKLRASVTPVLTTFINERIPALVARPGAPLWCPAEEPLPEAEALANLVPSSEAASPGTDAADSATATSAGFERIDRPVISLLPRLRRPFQERERPAPPWRGVAWSPRTNGLVSLSAPGTVTLVASQPTVLDQPPMPLIH